MATVTPPTPGVGDFKREDLRRKVGDPLERLRGYIRLYVALEGTALLVIYLALWFWIGLLVDYGFFRLFTVDWVQVLPKGLRIATLAVLLVGLVGLLVFKIVARLLKQFRDPAFALVLERRFPQLLGDRLITAVELADPKIAAECGYSQAMIDQTIREAAEMVDRIPVKDAFNWKRLNRHGWAALGLTLGVYLLVGVGYLAVGAAINSTREPDQPKVTATAGTYANEFNTVAWLWVERNLLLRNIIWPRRAYLELVGFPDDDPHTGKMGELPIGKNVGTVPIRVRSLKWVIADTKAPDGWRPLLWADLVTNRLFKGVPVPNMPAEWEAARAGNVDQLELRIEKDKVQLDKDKAQMPADAVLTRQKGHELFDAMFAELKKRGTDADMVRKFRMLEVPDEVVITYRGDQTRGDMQLKREENNEYSGLFADLKESVVFEACAADFCTRPKRIVVVPPPVLKTLLREDAHPAYLYHQPPSDGSPADLKGLKQRFAPQEVLLSGDRSEIRLPRGGDVKLTAIIANDKDKEERVKELVKVRMVSRSETRKGPDGQPLAAPPLPDVRLLDDHKTFVTEFTNVIRPIHFDFEFTDKDGVVGRRQIAIEPEPDTPPKLKIAVDPVVRKTNEGYKITPSALIPFTGSAEDDHGLASLQFYANVAKGETSGVVQARIEMAMRGFAFAPAAPGMNALLMSGYMTYVLKRVAPTNQDKAAVQTVNLPTFDALQKQRMRGAFSLDGLKARVKRDRPPQDEWPLRLHKFDQDEITEKFDVLKHLSALKAPEGQSQPRHRLELWVVATDTNVETGPGVTESDEHYNFIIVSEAELLAEISGEEAKLHDALQKVKKTVEDGRTALDVSVANLTDPNRDVEKVFAGEATRVSNIREAIKSSRDVAEGVFKDYRRLRHEMEVNRFNKEEVSRLGKVVQELENTLAGDGEFAEADRALSNFLKALDDKRYDPELARASRERIDQLLARLDSILDAIGTIIDFQKNIVDTQALISEQREVKRRIEEIKRQLSDLEFNK